MNGDFKSTLFNLLNAEFPGTFSCQSTNKGHAMGVTVKCGDRAGYAFVHEPSPAGIVLALHETEDDAEPEVWSARRLEEIVQRIRPWAFPPSWTRPAALDRAEEHDRLAKVLNGLRQRAGEVQCHSALASGKVWQLLTPESAAALEHDLTEVDHARLVYNFPMERDGRIALKTTVLLRICETKVAPGKDREICLAAVGPERRSDAQEIRIELRDLIVVNQSHRWENCPWLWLRNTEPPEEELLGAQSNTVPLAADRAALPDNATDSQRAAWCLELLDQGHFEEALSLYGISLSEPVYKLLGGERFRPPACCSHPDKGWNDLLLSVLRESAPWRLAAAVKEESERLKEWAAQKKGRKRHAPLLKLAIFPGQMHQRKTCLMVTADEDGEHPRLIFDATASNARLHDSGWKRPIQVDFLRYKIL